MPWILLVGALIIVGLAAEAARGRLGELPEPPVRDEWIAPPVDLDELIDVDRGHDELIDVDGGAVRTGSDTEPDGSAGPDATP